MVSSADDFSVTQLKRIRDHAHAISRLLSLISKKDGAEREKIAETLRCAKSTSDMSVKSVVLDDHYKWKEDEHKSSSMMPVLFAKVHEEVKDALVKAVCASTIRDWYSDFTSKHNSSHII